MFYYLPQKVCQMFSCMLTKDLQKSIECAETRALILPSQEMLPHLGGGYITPIHGAASKG